jgi:pimeloyl-ACP methyl ester carboxylesterase
VETKVILIRGLSTTGRDGLGLGPIHWGHTLAPVADALLQRGVESQILSNMGGGSLKDHAERAALRLKELDLDQTPLHLVGHSMGGLVARILACQKKFNIVAVTTFATPHRGAILADVAQRFPEERPYFYGLSKIVATDFARDPCIRELTPQKMRDWDTLFPNRPDVDYASFQFSLPPFKMSPLARAVLAQIPRNMRPSTSDGYVELESQYFAKSLGQFELDHLAQVGWNFQVWPPFRLEFHRQFHRFIDALSQRLLEF